MPNPRPLPKRPGGRPKGCRNSPEHNAKIAAAKAKRVGHTSAEVVAYAKAHSQRAAAVHFGITYSAVNQLVNRYG